MPDQPNRSSERVIVLRENRGKIAIALIAAVSSVAIAFIKNWSAIFPTTVAERIEIPQPPPDEDPTDPGGESDVGQMILSGEWVFQINGLFSLDSSGQRRKGSAHAEVAMSFSHEGDYIKGEYLWAENACPKATVLGKIVEGRFDLTIHHKGNCCGGAKTNFTGTLVSPIEIEGEFKPDGAPPHGNCNLWWADISGAKEI